MIVKRAVKEAVLKSGFRMSEDVFEALDVAVSGILRQAFKYAQDEKRKTIHAHDVIRASKEGQKA